MRRGSTSLLLLFLAILSAQLISRQELRAADVKELPQASERWALLVGVEDYTDWNISPMKGPANDVDQLRETLVKHAAFPRDNITVLSTKSPDHIMPTRTKILLALSKMKKTVPSNGLLLFMFSGHGISRGGRAFLLPSDAVLTDDASVLEDTSLPVDLVRQRIAETQLKQVIVFLDACRNDPEKSKAASGDNVLSKPFADALNFAEHNKEVEASAVIYATGIGERAWIDNKEELGYLAKAIIRGMSGAAVVDDSSGQVTLGSLVKYIQSNVPKWVAGDLKKVQKPFYVIAGYQPEQLVVSAIQKPPSSIVPASILLQQKEDAQGLFETSFKRYKIGISGVSEVLNANNMLLQAELDLSTGPSARVSAYQAALKRAQELESEIDKRVLIGFSSRTDVTEARFHRTQIEVGLAREQSKPDK